MDMSTSILIAACLVVVANAFVPPFSRDISVGDQGRDVIVFKNLLSRDPNVSNLDLDSDTFSSQDLKATNTFQSMHNLTVTTTVDSATSELVLKLYRDDNYKDDGLPASNYGKLYKILVPVHRNRSIETNATLQDSKGNNLFSFRVRAHGWNDCDCPKPWPNFDNTNDGLNMFSSNGNTFTGLAECDLNTPEPDPKTYGPYNINRAVKGLKGNAKFLIPGVRNGILLHTGEWPNWTPPESMPNSEGCIHSWPENIKTIASILDKLGVVAHKNTGGQLPYPYECQGLLSVYQID